MATLQRSDEDALPACLARIVATHLQRPSPIAAIERKRSQYSSFYASDIITVRLTDGDELRVFLKDFGSYDHPKDALPRRRERELFVYRDLLARVDLGTARYYGSAWDEAADRFWLFLEYVEGQPVRHYGFEYWVPAAAWLGRMQGSFAQRADVLAGYGALIRHDAAFFHGIAEQAVRSVSHFSPAYANRLEAVVCRYDRAVHTMASQPKTLVHGTYRPAQIIVDQSCQPSRFCPVDWEKAAVGSALYDLTFLADGFEPPRLDQILDAYREEAESHGMVVSDSDQMKHAMDCFRLHRVMNWLSLASARRFPESEVVKLLDRAEAVERLLQ